MKRVILAASLFLVGGCVVRVQPAYVVAEPRPVVVQTAVVEEPPPAEVIEGGVIVVEPALEFREYVYEPGFPPGCYLYGGFYWYGGRRYEHDFFRDRFVSWNLSHHRYEHVEENRRLGARIREQHRKEFAVHHGQPHGQAHGEPHGEHGRPAEEHR